MRKLFLALYLLSGHAFASHAFAQIGPIVPPGGGGSSSITADTTATTGCTDGGFLYSLTSLVRCGANAINSGSTVTIGGGISGTNKALIVNNATSTGNIFEAQDNATPVFTIANGGGITGTGNYTFSTASTGMTLSNQGFIKFYGNNDVQLAYYQTNTPDQVFFAIGPTSYSLGIRAYASISSDLNNGPCGSAACTDPTLIISPVSGTTTQYNALAAWGQAGGALKTLTESVATSVVRIPVANLAGAFGDFCYTVKAADATDSQIRGSCIKYTVTAKAGTETCSLNTQAALTSDASIAETEDGSGSGAITVGTLTYAITCDTTPANAVDIQINAVSSLTQTTLNVQYSLNHVGPGQPARQ